MQMSFDEFCQPPKRSLSGPQERRLNRLYAIGDASGGAWDTIRSLIAAGYVENNGGKLAITEKGAHYCHHHGAKLPI